MSQQSLKELAEDLSSSPDTLPCDTFILFPFQSRLLFCGVQRSGNFSVPATLSSVFFFALFPRRPLAGARSLSGRAAKVRNFSYSAASFFQEFFSAIPFGLASSWPSFRTGMQRYEEVLNLQNPKENFQSFFSERTCRHNSCIGLFSPPSLSSFALFLLNRDAKVGKCFENARPSPEVFTCFRLKN